jgi:hypothetical protein
VIFFKTTRPNLVRLNALGKTFPKRRGASRALSEACFAEKLKDPDIPKNRGIPLQSDEAYFELYPIHRITPRVQIHSLRILFSILEAHTLASEAYQQGAFHG